MEMYQLLSVNDSITVLSLRPYTTYILTIAAETAIGVGPFSEAYTVMTATDGKEDTHNILILITWYNVDKSQKLCAERINYISIEVCT